jgi:hypothetical protein
MEFPILGQTLHSDVNGYSRYGSPLSIVELVRFC